MGNADRTSISLNHLAYRWKVEMKRREGIKEGGNKIKGSKKKRDEKKKRETIWHSKIKLVIGLVSNIKEHTSSNFAEDDIFNTTLFSLHSLII